MSGNTITMQWNIMECMLCRVDAAAMGAVCGVAFMGAPIILIEKLSNGQEPLLALQRVRQVLASGVCEGEGAGRVSGGGVEVVQKTCTYPVDNSQFPMWLAKDEDLQKIDVNDPKIPLVSLYIAVCMWAYRIYYLKRDMDI